MRTCSNGVELKKNGKWAVKFVTYAGQVGNEYVANEVESAAVFDSEDEAYDGQIRALDMLEVEGKYPNMCEKF